MQPHNPMELDHRYSREVGRDTSSQSSKVGLTDIRFLKNHFSRNFYLPPEKGSGGPNTEIMNDIGNKPNKINF